MKLNNYPGVLFFLACAILAALFFTVGCGPIDGPLSPTEIQKLRDSIPKGPDGDISL